MTDDQLEVFYLNNMEIMTNNSIPWMIIKFLGWMIFKGLVWVASKCEDLYDITFGLIDFTSWSGVNEFVENFKPLFIALMAVSIFALGIMLILGKEKKPKIITNICIAVLCVTSSTVVFQQFNDIAKDLKAGIDNIEVQGAEFNGVYDIVSNNLIDLVYLDQKLGMKNINYEKEGDDLPKPTVTEENFKYIDYTEVLNYKSDYDWNKNGNAEDILQKKLVILSKGAGFDVFKIREVYNGFGWNSNDDTDICNEFYYRYEFSFFTAILQVLSIIIIYISMSYKCIRIEWELVIARLLAYLYSAELSGGEKIGKILIFIRDSYIMLLLTTICIRVFYIASAFVQKEIDNAFAEGVIILFLAFCVIDGPNLVEKLLGMDLGLGQSTARMMAAYGMFKGAANVAAAPFKFGFKQHEKHQMFNRMEKGQNSKAPDSGINNNAKSDFNPSDVKNNENGNNQNDDFKKKNDNTDVGDESNIDKNTGDAVNEQNGANMDVSEKQNTSFMDNVNVNEKTVNNESFDTSFMDKETKNRASSFTPKESKVNSDILNRRIKRDGDIKNE